MGVLEVEGNVRIVRFPHPRLSVVVDPASPFLRLAGPRWRMLGYPLRHRCYPPKRGRQLLLDPHEKEDEEHEMALVIDETPQVMGVVARDPGDVLLPLV